MRNVLFLLLITGLLPLTIPAQQTLPNKVKFFEEEKILRATLATDVRKLLSGKMKDGTFMPATFTLYLSDKDSITDKIAVEPRGNFRRKNCYVPPIRLNFKKYKNVFSSFGALKLVSPCRNAADYEQLLIVEYLIYKMYNLFTEKSFRARMLELTFKDTTDKKKDFTLHTFLLEDSKDMAKRNHMTEWKKFKVLTEQTNREQTTLMAIFEYMIGNTDWAVPNTHNIRLNYDSVKQKDYPYAVPYDFDYCGLVNADYAVPFELFNLENIRQRLYRGYPREMEELVPVLDSFRQKKEAIYALINNCTLLRASKKRDLIDYLESFYDVINDPRKVKEEFITNARKE